MGKLGVRQTENLSGIGVPLPEFFRKAVSKLKLNVESKSVDTGKEDVQ